MPNTELELKVIKSVIESGTSPVKGIPVDIAYHPDRGWTLVTYTESFLPLSGEDRKRFADWLIDQTVTLNGMGIVTYLERG